MKKNHINQEFLTFKSQKEVAQAVDLICQKGAENLYDKYLVDKWPQYLAEDIMFWNDGILSQKHIITDKGEAKIVLQHKWAVEPEPIPTPIDNQGRYAVKTELKQTNEAMDNEDETKSMVSGSSFGFSIKNSVASSKFNKSGVGKSSKFKNSTLKNLQLAKSQLTMERSGDISKIQDEEEEEYKVDLIKTGDDSAPPTPDPISEKLRDNREKKDREKAIKNKNESKQAEEDLKSKEVQKEMQKQLKHKNFTYDTDGTFIYIKQKPNHISTIPGANSGDNQPPPQDGFGLEFKNPNKKLGDIERLPNMKEENRIPKEVNLMNEFKKNKKDKKEAEGPVTLEFHKQPNLVDFLNPKTGVNVVFQNGFKKEGGPVQIGNKMRKDEYTEMIENQPNRPIPQYLQNEQNLEVPTASQAENRLKSKLLNYKDFKKRPQTAGNYYELQGLLIGDQDLYVDMMADEQPIYKRKSQNSNLYGNSYLQQSRMTHKSGKQSMMNFQMGDKSVINNKEQKKRPLTSQAQNKIHQYKKKQIGLKGEEYVNYDMGIDQDIKKSSQMEKIQEQSADSNFNDNVHKMRAKINKFDSKIRENKNWGQLDSDISHQHNKKKARPTSYTTIKPSSAKLGQSQSTRTLGLNKLHHKQIYLVESDFGKSSQQSPRIPSLYNNNNGQSIKFTTKTKPQSGVPSSRNNATQQQQSEQQQQQQQNNNNKTEKNDYKRIQSAKQ